MFNGILYAGFGVVIGWSGSGRFVLLCQYSRRGYYANFMEGY